MFCVKFYEMYAKSSGFKRDLDYISKNGLSKEAIERYAAKYSYKTFVPIAFLGAWQKNKQIFRFTNELKEEVLKTADALSDIPGEILERLPYDSFYVQATFNCHDGFFVHYEPKDNAVEVLLIKIILGDVSLVPYVIDTSAPLRKTVQSIMKQTPYKTDNVPVSKSEILSDIQKTLALLLYICSENADIKPIEKVKASKPDKKKKPVKKANTEPVINAVGEEAAVIIRNMHQTAKRYESSSTGTGKKKAAHVRKAHWHHFWTGSGAEKKLIVRWIPPVFVNKDDVANVTINNF